MILKYLKTNKLIIMLYSMITIILLAIAFLVTLALKKDPVDPTLELRSMIDTIGVIDSFDSDWVNPSTDDVLWGTGAVANIDYDWDTLYVWLFDYEQTVYIEIEFEDRFLREGLFLYDINIAYINMRTEISSDVTWFDFADDATYHFKGEVDELRDYLLMLTPDDIYTLLMDNQLIKK